MRRQVLAKEAEKGGVMESVEEGDEVPLVDHGSKKEGDDRANILLLLFLYVLQGIPLGLAGSIPMILQNRNISYKDQATFSFSFWPFSLKLLWAPLVDSCFSAKFGRRKSWMIPAQYLIGIFMWVLSANIDDLLGEDLEHPPNVILITAIFFALNFLAATQDIAVDGWALTMLSKENLGWASTCNSVGQTAGYFLGYVVFLALESKDFCVNFLGLEDSLVTLPGFLYFWGFVFMITTTLVGVLKSEDDDSHLGTSEERDFGLIGTYRMLWSILGMAPIKQTVLVLLTCKIGFAAADSLTVLKLTESGVPKDRLALLSIPLTPVQVFLPLFISRYTAGPRPMDIFLGAFPIRLLFGLVFAGLVWITPVFHEGEGHFPFYYYGLIVAVYIIHQIVANCMFVAVMAFFARISDASVGGTYMTLLNTFTNLGGNWPAWIALRFVPELTWKGCQGAISVLKCDTAAEQQACKVDGGTCVTELDGYYVESVIFVVFGFMWLMWGRPVIKHLQSLPKSIWLVSSRKK